MSDNYLVFCSSVITMMQGRTNFKYCALCSILRDTSDILIINNDAGSNKHQIRKIIFQFRSRTRHHVSLHAVHGRYQTTHDVHVPRDLMALSWRRRKIVHSRLRYLTYFDTVLYSEDSSGFSLLASSTMDAYTRNNNRSQ